MALRLCLDRLAPPRKGSPVQFPLPPCLPPTMPLGPLEPRWKRCLCCGRPAPPKEGAQVMGRVDSYRRTLEVTELEARLAVLEGQRG